MMLYLKLTLVTFILISSAQGKIISFDATQNSIELESRTSQELVFNTHVKDISFETIKTNNGSFTTIEIPGFHKSHVIGQPLLPTMNQLLDLPIGGPYSLNIIESEYETINLLREGYEFPIVPTQASISKSQNPSDIAFEQDLTLYETDAFYAIDMIELIDKGQMRDIHLGLLKISPIQYNPVTHEVRIYHSIRFSIDLENADWNETFMTKQKNRSSAFSAVSNQILDTSCENVLEDLVVAPIKMLIVANTMFQSTLQPFIEWKRVQGFTIIEGYLGQDGLGTTANAIKTYLHNLYNAGTVDDPSPSYVLLIGDIAQMPTFVGTTDSNHKTDLPYVDVTGDELPEMYQGRIPVTTTTMLQNVLDKTMMYERYEMADPSYLGEVVMIAGVDATFGPTHGNGQINYGTQQYFNPAHDILSHTYLYPGSGSSSSAIVGNASNGVGYINYTAHGSPDSWSEPYFSISNVNSLQNSQKYFTAVANACLTAKFDENICVGEAFIRGEDKGAIGYIGGTNSTYWDEDYYWGVGFGPVIGSGATYEQTSWGMYDGIFHDHGEPQSEWTVSNAAMIYRGNLAVTESGSSRDYYYWEIYELFGDPSLMTYMGVPAESNVSTPDVLILGESEISISATPYAYIALSYDGALLAVAEANAFGTATLTFDPSGLAPGSMDIVVTNQFTQPYMGQIQILAPDGPYIVFNNYTLYDEYEYANGQADFGERIHLALEFTNVGVDTAYNVSFAISTNNPYLNIVNNIAGGVDIAPNEIYISEYLDVDIATNSPDGHIAGIQILSASGPNTWEMECEIPLHAPSPILLNTLVNDNNNHRLDIGESTSIQLNILNDGTSDLLILPVISMSTENQYITLSSADIEITPFLAGETIHPEFDISISSETPVGQEVILDWQIMDAAMEYFIEGSFLMIVGLIVEDFESGNFNQFDWQHDGFQIWNVQSADVYEGVFAAQSGNISDDQSSEMILAIDVNVAGDLSFFYKVSSESGTPFYDGLKFYIDGNLADQWQGEIPWTQVSFPLETGFHELSWIYEKDGSVTHGEDCAWVDFITIPGGQTNGGYTLGDINNDGNIDILDVVRLVNIILGTGNSPTPNELLAADFNVSGQVDVGDLVSIVNMILGGSLARESDNSNIALILKNQELRLKSSAPIAAIDIKYKGILNTDIPQFEKAQAEMAGENHVLLYTRVNNPLIGDFLLGHVGADFELIEINVATSNGQLIVLDKGMQPTEFALAQNYPNPFNPVTTIQIELPINSDVSLAIYNIKGEEVIRLVDGNMNAGYHKVQWHATNNYGQTVPGGIYFYRMIAGEFQSVKRMIIIK